MDIKLNLQNISKAVNGKLLLNHVSFAVPEGRIVAIIGPSGAGKSTLLSLINRLQDPTGGAIYLDGTNIQTLDVFALRRRVGMVFQQPALFPGTVASNIAFGPHLSGHELTRPVAEFLREVGLAEEFAKRDASRLSGGEQQRVALARALANNPEVLLLDEPTSALDLGAAHQVEDLITQVCKHHGLTAMWVSHDLEQAQRVSDRTVLMVGGRKIEEGNTASFFAQPKTEIAQAFLAGEIGVSKLQGE